MFVRSERRRQQLVWTLTDLLATGHELPAALTLLAKRAGAGWGGAVYALRARVEQGEPPRDAKLLPGEVSCLLELPLDESAQRSALATLGAHLRHVAQLARSPLLALIYPLLLAFMLVSTAKHLLGVQLGTLPRPVTATLASVPALTLVLLVGMLLAYQLWWRRGALRQTHFLALARTSG